MPTLQQTEKQKLKTEHNIKLTSAEIANLWSSYQNDSLAVCTIGTFLSKVEDNEIRSIIEFALLISQAHVQKLKSFFLEEQISVPDGFSVEIDVNKEAPSLYT